MKTITTTFKTNWKSIFWLGPILIIVGLSAGLVSGAWGAVPLSLLIAGIVILGLWLLFLGRGSGTASDSSLGFWRRRSTQASTNALVATLAVLAILGLINFLGARYVARVDLTENQAFSLAPQSQQVLRNLKQPVKVWVFDQQPNPRIRALLEQYQRQGEPWFSFEFVDPQVQPGLAQKYKVQSLGEVHLESGQRERRLEQAPSESNLTPAIEQITSSAQQAKVYFLQGHGERSLQPGQGSFSQALEALKTKRNFGAEPLNLVERREIPQDAAVVVIAGPKQTLFPAEVKRLQDYLRRGGGLLLMLDPQTKPGIENLLKDWKVQLDPRLVVDTSGAGQAVGLGPAIPLINQYGQHPITQDFQGFSFYPLAQSIQTSQGPAEQATELLRTGEQSWAEGNPESENLQFDPARDRRGPLTLGVALSRPANQAKPARESRLVVIGDSDFATDGAFNQQLNGNVFLNAVTWLSNRPNQILSIQPKEPTNRRINLTAETGRLIALIAMGALPLAAFGIATAFWWRRR